MAAAGAWASGTTRPKAARTSPSQATSASVVSATMGTNQRSDTPESWSMRSTTNSSSAWIEASAAAIMQRAAHLVPAPPDLRSCQSATGRDEDEALAAPVGIAHVCTTLPGLRSAASSASGRALTMSSRVAPARRAMKTPSSW